VDFKQLSGYEVFMAYQTLKVDLDPRGVLSVTISRPDIRNAFNEVMIAELTAVCEKEAVRPEVRLIVLRGEGAVFCAGGDLNWMKKSVELDLQANLEDTRKLTKMFRLLNECPKPIVGQIHGAAIGGGVGLVSICDIAIASQETQFSLSEVRLGIVPSCIGPFVIAKIGASHARSLFVSAERFLAPRAREIGLVHEVAASPKELQAAVERVVSNMLQCGPQAMATAKRLILDLSWPERRESVARGGSDYCEYVSKTLAELRVSPEGQEGLKAFLEKRHPSWIRK
jgi:methylglutaconyl-CoA hydratase